MNRIRMLHLAFLVQCLYVILVLGLSLWIQEAKFRSKEEGSYYCSVEMNIDFSSLNQHTIIPKNIQNLVTDSRRSCGRIEDRLALEAPKQGMLQVDETKITKDLDLAKREERHQIGQEGMEDTDNEISVLMARTQVKINHVESTQQVDYRTGNLVGDPNIAPTSNDDPKETRSVLRGNNKHNVVSHQTKSVTRTDDENSSQMMVENGAKSDNWTLDAAKQAKGDTLKITDPLPEGYLNDFFEKLTLDPLLSQFVKTRSSPSLTNGQWIVTLDGFLTRQEAKGLITSTLLEDPYRTMSNRDLPCDTEIANRILQRLSVMTGLDSSRGVFRFSRYEVPWRKGSGGLVDLEMPIAPHGSQRLLHIALTLFDEDDGIDGGVMIFPSFGVEVAPRFGRALLWTDADHCRKDSRKATAKISQLNQGELYLAHVHFRV